MIRLCFSSLGARERWKLEISTVRKGHPAASTSCFSRPRRAPTNKISLSGFRSLIRPASARAGFTWPAVPPQVNRTFIRAPPLYPALGALICRETESTIPTSTNWMASAVPP